MERTISRIFLLFPYRFSLPVSLHDRMYTCNVNLTSQVMLVIGGQAPKAIRSVECYDFKEDRWCQLAEMPSRRCRCGKEQTTDCC